MVGSALDFSEEYKLVDVVGDCLHLLWLVYLGGMLVTTLSL
jgi:hypothetical protein